jgi:hypothetical protein
MLLTVYREETLEIVSKLASQGVKELPSSSDPTRVRTCAASSSGALLSAASPPVLQEDEAREELEGSNSTRV